jgi:hypothetical protein
VRRTACNRQRATDSVQQTACNRQCATDNVQQTACNRQRDHVVYSQRRLRGAVRASRRRHQSAHRHASVGPARPHRLRVSSGAALPCGGLRSIQLATTCDNMRQHATACGVHAATGMGLSAARRTSTRMPMRLPTHEPRRELFCCVAAYCNSSQRGGPAMRPVCWQGRFISCGEVLNARQHSHLRTIFAPQSLS